MRGVAQLAMVEEMEELTGKPVSELFDLVVGTSIGGCGALFVSCFPRKGSAPKMARRALRELQTRCFARTSALRLLWQGQYAADDRRQFMIELCGYRQIGGFWIPSGAGRARSPAAAARQSSSRSSSARTEPPGHLHLAGTSRRLWQAVEATSAAPLVFPHSIFREELSRRWWRRRVAASSAAAAAAAQGGWCSSTAASSPATLRCSRCARRTRCGRPRRRLPRLAGHRLACRRTSALGNHGSRARSPRGQ